MALLNLLKPAFSAYGTHAKVGAPVFPIQWDGDWLQVGLSITPVSDLYFWFHRSTVQDFLGVSAESLMGLPFKPPIVDPPAQNP
jgi:hypothetical protein